MLNRRTFLRQTACSVAGGALAMNLLHSEAQAAKLSKIGVQLYTVRNQMAKDFDGSLKKIAELGFKEVEFAGYYNRTPQQIKTLLGQLGLDAPSAHVAIDALRNSLNQTIETAKTIGHRYLICPFLMPPERLDLARALREAEIKPPSRKVAELAHDGNTQWKRWMAADHNQHARRLRGDLDWITLRALEREAEAARQIFDTFLETYKKTDRQEELQESQARVISYAAIPERPSYPNTGLVLSLAMIAALFSGLIFALILEKLDNTYRSAGQLESALGFPCHALVPQVAGLSGPEVAAYILDKPASTVAESVRTMRMAVNLRASQAQRPKVITITSSFPGEGKTTLSLWLARLAAKSGEKVIIIDADLRRPNVHKSLGRENDASLAEYLNGKKKFEEVVRKDDMSGLHMIFGRSLPGHALDLVGSKRMEKLVKSLREVYDLVIIDSAAALAVSDARILATLSDQLLYVVSWDQTPREVVHSGVKQFADMNYTSLGFVLTNVDVERHALYGYGDTAHYYGRYKEYYIN